MWLAGYWMERGYRPEEIFAMPRMEQGIMQAIAELNREQCKEDVRDAFLEALSILLPGK